MISFIISVFKFIILIGFLVLIHEGGHFLVAKLCKVKVNEFAIGFGPTIWSKQTQETKYALRLIPLGGFVSMVGEETPSDLKGSFSKKPVYQRIAIVFAGGFVNIVFALILYFGIISYNGNFTSLKVEKVIDNFSASQVDIQAGDIILKINNKNIHLQSDIKEILKKSKDEKVEIELSRNGKIEKVELEPTEVKENEVGIYFGNSINTEIKSISPGSPAEKAGLKQKDKILAVNGLEVDNNPYKVESLTNENVEEKILYKIQRKNEILDIEVVPNVISNYYIGVQLQKADNTFLNNVYYGFWNTVKFSTSILDNLKMMFSGKISTNQLMGPIGISEVVSDTRGINQYIYILALISLSLGVTNLLPFPPLDGGKILLLIIEAIRRKPMDENLELQIQTIGFILMIILSIYVAYNDILRLF